MDSWPIGVFASVDAGLGVAGLRLARGRLGQDGSRLGRGHLGKGQPGAAPGTGRVVHAGGEGYSSHGSRQGGGHRRGRGAGDDG